MSSPTILSTDTQKMKSKKNATCVLCVFSILGKRNTKKVTKVGVLDWGAINRTISEDHTHNNSSLRRNASMQKKKQKTKTYCLF